MHVFSFYSQSDMNDGADLSAEDEDRRHRH